MIRSMHQTGITSPTQYTTTIEALGAEIITGHIIATGVGATDCSLDGSINGSDWVLLASAPIVSPGYSILNHLPGNPASGGSYRYYRLNFAVWTLPFSCEIWISAQGHAPSNIPDLPL